jgi:hypothetical protein
MNQSSQINQTELPTTTLKSTSSTPVHSHIRVKHLPRTMRNTHSRSSALLAFCIREIP